MRAAAALVAAAWALAAYAESSCDIGIAGAGPGGAYAAWRAALAGRSVCVFELAPRPGGRVHSLRKQGPRQDLTVEAGAYRFAPEPIISRFHNLSHLIYTPLTAAIVAELGLASAVYNPNPNDWDHGMHKIVDERGHDAGYLTFVERMLHEATLHGARVYYNAKVVAITRTHAGRFGMRLASGEDHAVKAILLNLPQRPLIELLRNSPSPVGDIFPRPLYDVIPDAIMKLYVHYDDAWWRNDLGLDHGRFQNTPKAQPCVNWDYTPSQEPAPVSGSYHDGDVRCDGAGGRCRGFLQAFYGSEPGVSYYKVFTDSIKRDSAVQIAPSKPHHAELLAEVHRALVELHREALDAANATARVSAERPTGAVLSIWDEGVSGIHAGCHATKPGTNPKPEELTAEALQPFPQWPIFVANEGYGTLKCFAEGSLVMADAALVGMNISTLPWDKPAPQQFGATSPGPPTDPAFWFAAADAAPAPPPATARQPAVPAVV